LYAVALHECPFGGAAKARRWAAPQPESNQPDSRTAGQPDMPLLE